MAISNKMSILGTKKAVAAYNGGYYLPSVSDKGILSWSPTVEGMAPIPEVNVRGPQGSDASVTAEAVQAVVPIACGENHTGSSIKPTAGLGSVSIGFNASSKVHGVAIGENATASSGDTVVGQGSKGSTWSCAIGYGTTAGTYCFAGGVGVQALNGYAVALGYNVTGEKATAVTIGSAFEDTSGKYECQTQGTGSITIGAGANTLNNGDIESSNSVTIGCKAGNTAADSIVLGAQASGSGTSSITLGTAATSSYPTSITLGSQFTETSDSGDTTFTCSTQGVGSITIGAGANTLNNGDTESSNSVTIGCKAENKGADSIVIGAGANGTNKGIIVIGTKATAGSSSLSIGTEAKSSFEANVSIGHKSEAYAQATLLGNVTKGAHSSCALGYASNAAKEAIALGHAAKANAEKTIAIGKAATASDIGATVIRSTAEDGTYTQLYFSGANTPLAKKYFPTAWEQKQDVDPETNEPLFDENGDPVMVDDKDKPIAGDAMMGFVARDKDGNIIARGANMLSALFPYYTGDDENPFAPTTMSLRPGDEPQEVMAFHPSDLDLPVEEPEETEEPEVGESEPAKYIPLPVYPIVEPEIPEIEEV